MVSIKTFIILIIMIINITICCKQKETNNFKKNSVINQKAVLKEKEKDTLPLIILSKYKSKNYFKLIIKKDLFLINDINRTHINKTGFEYKEMKIDEQLYLCQFIFFEEVQYNYYYKDKKLIYKELIPINKAKLNIEYYDWNNDKKSEIINIYEQWEGGGGFAYSKIKTIYDVHDDTVMKIVSLPIESILCQSGKLSIIKKYSYEFFPIKNELMIKQIVGKGNCETNKIKVIDAVTHKYVKLKQYDNVFLDF